MSVALITSLRIPALYTGAVKWLAIRSFYTVVVFQLAGHQRPTLCVLLLEILFDRQMQGLPLGLQAGVLHPFAEPRSVKKVTGTSKEEPVRSEQVRIARDATLCILQDALGRLLHWALREHHEFLTRVVHWESRRQKLPKPENLEHNALVHREEAELDAADQVSNSDSEGEGFPQRPLEVQSLTPRSSCSSSRSTSSNSSLGDGGAPLGGSLHSAPGKLAYPGIGQLQRHQ